MGGLFDKQVAEVFDIKENGAKEILSLLKPYLENPFKRSIDLSNIPEEFMAELEPERYKDTFLEYELSIIIDWNDRFNMIDSWEYLDSCTMEKLEITPEDAKRSAIRNMDNNPRLDFLKVNSDKYGTDVYVIKTNRQYDLHPSFVCSVLTLNDYWKNIVCEKIGEIFFILPLFREMVFVIPGTDLKNASGIGKKLKSDYEKKRYEVFSEEIYKYMNGNIV